MHSRGHGTINGYMHMNIPIKGYVTVYNKVRMLDFAVSLLSSKF